MQAELTENPVPECPIEEHPIEEHPTEGHPITEHSTAEHPIPETPILLCSSTIDSVSAGGDGSSFELVTDITPVATETQPTLIKDTVYYMDTVVFKVQNHLFKVPTYYFRQQTSFFASHFASLEVEEKIGAEKFIELEDVTPSEFRALLKFIYPIQINRLQDVPPAPTTNEWIDILKLSTQWMMLDIRRVAITKLSSANIRPADRVVLAREHKVDSWLRSACLELAKTASSMSQEDMNKIGLATAVKIHKARERYMTTRKTFDYPIDTIVPNVDQSRSFRFQGMTAKRSAVDRVPLARAHGVAEWLREAFIELVKRPEPLSVDESRNLGFDTAIRLYTARERRLDRRTVTSLIPTSTVSNLINQVLREELERVTTYQPVERAVLAQRYGVMEWLREAFFELMKRPEAISISEAKVLGHETAIKLAIAREAYTINLRNSRSPLSPDSSFGYGNVEGFVDKELADELSAIPSYGPVERVLIAREAGVDEWLQMALDELVRRKETVSDDEAVTLGLDTSIQLCRFRLEDIGSSPWSSSWTDPGEINFEFKAELNEIRQAGKRFIQPSTVLEGEGGPRTSEEAQLLNELDLSAREETVQYKPNPFSIAKINAVSRGHCVKDKVSNKSPSRKQQPSIRPPVAIIKNKRGDKVRPSIIDQLKKQPQKATRNSNLKKAAPATSFYSSVPLNPVSSKPISFDPLLTPDVDVDATRPFHAVEPNSSNVPAETHIPTSDGSAGAMHLSSLPESSQIAHIINPSAQILSVPYKGSSSHSNLLEDESTVAIEDASTEPLADNEHNTLTAAFPQIPDADITFIDAKTSALSAPVLAPSPSHSEGPPVPLGQGRCLDPRLNFNSPRTLTMKSTFDSNLKSTRLNKHLSRSRPLSLSSPPQQQNTRTPVLSSFTASSRFRAAVMSSPLRPADHLSRDMPRMPVIPFRVATDASLGAPFLHQPLGKFPSNPRSSITMGRNPSPISSPVHFADDDYLYKPAPSPRHTYEVEDRPNRPPFSSSSGANRPSLSRFSTPLRKVTPGRTMEASPLDKEPPSRSGLVLTPCNSRHPIDDFAYDAKSGNTWLHPEDIDVQASPGSVTPTESARVLAFNPDSIVYYSNTDHGRSHPAYPGPKLTKGRPYPVKDAYDLLSSDPDENWGTLPIRKKVKTRLVFFAVFPANVLKLQNSDPSPVMRTRKFRLPKLGFGDSKVTVPSKIEKTGVKANSARRVITFLPPPLKPASTRLESESKVVCSRAAYPSPSYSVPKSSSSPLYEKPVCLESQRRPPTRGTGTEACKPLSPPPSDSCVTPDKSTFHAPIEVMEDTQENDVHTPINLPSIARLYPGMKATWRRVGYHRSPLHLLLINSTNYNLPVLPVAQEDD
ncbi:hypothetical protein C0992_001100 [Termitomyces sp. T32_za158]|nr:hypothetical protein C0992_001100 [Termitomyces sp. T32_za158]